MGLTLADPESAQLSLDLTELEQNTLHVCEEVIERNLKAFMETGDALATIRDGRLYRATDASFEAYCRRKWNLSRPYAYELMDAAEIAGQVSASSESPAPVNPAQALALKNVPEENRAEVWKEAVATAPEGKVTAAHVSKVARRRSGNAGASMQYTTIAYLKEPLYTRLIQESERQGVTQSEIVRLALTQYFGGEA